MLGQVVGEYSVGVFSEVLLECSGEKEEGRARRELETLHHALLVVHKKVGTAGQNVAVLHLRWRAFEALIVAGEPL